MPFPAIPRENSNSLARLDNNEAILDQIRRTSLDIHSLFLYLERLREGSFSTVSESIAGNPSGVIAALSNILTDSATIDFIIATLSIAAEVKEHSLTLSKLQDINNQTLLGKGSGTSVEQISLGNGLSIVGSTLEASGAFDREVGIGETRTITHTSSFVVSRYFKVFGELVLQGDGALQVL